MKDLLVLYFKPFQIFAFVKNFIPHFLIKGLVHIMYTITEFYQVTVFQFLQFLKKLRKIEYFAKNKVGYLPYCKVKHPVVGRKNEKDHEHDKYFWTPQI